MQSLSMFNRMKYMSYHAVACGPSEPKDGNLRYSDIVLHLPVLEYFASKCRHVTEFGVREGHSTVALMAGTKEKLVSYDIQRSSFVDFFLGISKPQAWEFHEADTGDPTFGISPTEMLFIDTLHTYEHVKKELTLNGRAASKYLAFHDTSTCGDYDLSGPDPKARGILDAIAEFCFREDKHGILPIYHTVYRTDCNNGLWVLERVK